LSLTINQKTEDRQEGGLPQLLRENASFPCRWNQSAHWTAPCICFGALSRAQLIFGDTLAMIDPAKLNSAALYQSPSA